MIVKDRFDRIRGLALFCGTVCLVGACLFGCRSSMPEELALRARNVVFVNDTDAPARDITLSVPMLREDVKCSHVPPRGRRSVEFSTRDYGANVAIVSWRHRGRMWHSEPDVALTPKGIDRGRPIELEITLGEQGRVKMAIIQPGE